LKNIAETVFEYGRFFCPCVSLWFLFLIVRFILSAIKGEAVYIDSETNSLPFK